MRVTTSFLQRSGSGGGPWFEFRSSLSEEGGGGFEGGIASYCWRERALGSFQLTLRALESLLLPHRPGRSRSLPGLPAKF